MKYRCSPFSSIFLLFICILLSNITSASESDQETLNRLLTEPYEFIVVDGFDDEVRMRIEFSNGFLRYWNGGVLMMESRAREWSTFDSSCIGNYSSQFPNYGAYVCFARKDIELTADSYQGETYKFLLYAGSFYFTSDYPGRSSYKINPFHGALVPQ